MRITTAAPGRRTATRIAAIALTAAALGGLGSVAAFADTPAQASVQSLGQITNLTPYTWTLDNSQTPNLTYAVNPPQTLAPGQTASWSADFAKASFMNTDYVFTDASGVKHDAVVQEYSDGTRNVDAQYLDAAVNMWKPATDFHLAGDPDGHAAHQDAIWNSPTTVTIDNDTDQAGATAAVDNELPRAVGQVTWVPNDGAKATFSFGPATRASSMLYNHSDESATIAAGQETTKGESTSLGQEVTAKLSTKVFGLAASVAASVDAGQDWGSADSIGVDVDTEVDPGQVGWIDKRTSVASLAGELTFTTPEGITFDLKNVSISQGDIANPNGQLPVGVNYVPGGHALGDADAPAGTGAAAQYSAAATTPEPLPAAAPGQLVVIDAGSDKGQALTALKMYESATDRSFTPSAAPQYQQTPWTDVLGPNGKAVSVSGSDTKPLSQRLDISHETTSSWSLGGSIETSVGFDLVETVDAELSYKMTLDHTWESKSTDTEYITATAAKNKTVWIESTSSVVSYTGDFAFTAADGVRYVVENVSITQPAAPDASGLAATSYRVMQLDSSAAGLPAGTDGGVIPISQLPALQNYIAQGH